MSEGSKNNNGQNTDSNANPVKRPNPVIRLKPNIPKNETGADNVPETVAPDTQKVPDTKTAPGIRLSLDPPEKKSGPSLRLNPNIKINNNIIRKNDEPSDAGKNKGPVIRLNPRIVKPKDIETEEAGFEVSIKDNKPVLKPAEAGTPVVKPAENIALAKGHTTDAKAEETTTENKTGNETGRAGNSEEKNEPRIRKGPRLNTRIIKPKDIEEEKNKEERSDTSKTENKETADTAPERKEIGDIIPDKEDGTGISSDKPDDENTASFEEREDNKDVSAQNDDDKKADDNNDYDEEDDDEGFDDDDDEENILGKILTGIRGGFTSFIESLISLKHRITHEVIIAWLLVLFGAAVYVSLTFNNNVWLDEAFTASLVDTDMAGVLQRSMADTLPPLYNIILKLSTDVFGYTVPVMKLTSTIPIILTMILGATVVRKRFGALTSYIFILALTVMPNMLFYGVEIRMYSLGFLFATASGIFAYEVLVEPRIRNWILFTLSSVLAGYSHHFAFVAVGFVYLCLLIYAILRHMNFEDDEDDHRHYAATHDDHVQEDEDDDYDDRVYNDGDEGYYNHSEEYDNEDSDDQDEDDDYEEDDETDDSDDDEDDESDDVDEDDEDDSLDDEHNEIKKYPVNLLHFVICLAATIILYIPCLVVTIRQLHSVSQYFSMPDVTFKVFIKYCRYPFTVGFTPFSILLFAVCIALFIRLCIRRNKSIKDWFMMYCFMLYYGVLLFGTFVSKMMSANIFVDRYLFFSLGLIWLFFSVEAASLKKPLVYAVIVLELLTGVYSYTQAYTSEYAPDANETIKWLADNVKDGDSLYTLEDYEELAWCLTFYRKGLTNYESLNEAVDAAGDGNVWIAVMDGYETKTATELPTGNLGYAAYVDDLENKGYSMEYVGVLRFDRYRLKMYKLIINKNE